MNQLSMLATTPAPETPVITTSKAMTADLPRRAARIKGATRRLAQAFVDCIGIVGPELMAARETLSRHGDGTFGQWCEEHAGMTRQRANQLIRSHEIMKRLETTVSNLPSSESQCRALARVPEDQQFNVWSLILAQSESTGKPVIAKMVTEVAETVVAPRAPAVTPEPPREPSEPDRTNETFNTPDDSDTVTVATTPVDEPDGELPSDESPNEVITVDAVVPTPEDQAPAMEHDRVCAAMDKLPEDDRVMIIRAYLATGSAKQKSQFLQSIFANEKKTTIGTELRDALEPIARKFLGVKKSKAAPKGKHPSLDDVIEYAVEQATKPRHEQSVDCAEEFFCFYEANGWVQGSRGKPIAKWQAAFRNWVLGQKDKPRKFRAPFLKEVEAYAKEIGNKAPEHALGFFEFYTTNGWVQGNSKKPIVDWKPCFDQWSRKQGEGMFSTNDSAYPTPKLMVPYEGFADLASQERRRREATKTEVEAYAKKLGGEAPKHAESFHDFYESNGWVQGTSKKPIVDWKPAFRTWLKNQAEGKFDGNARSNEKPIYDPSKTFPLVK